MQQELDVAVLEVVGRLLDLVLVVHIAVGHALRPGQVEHVLHALQIHREALQTIGDLAGDRLAVDAADLLEIGELRHFHAVQPHLPAQPPRPERRVLPIVLDETDVVLLEIETECFQRTEVQIEDVGRRRFQHHLELVVMLQAVRILARSEEHTSELQSPKELVCRLLLEKKKEYRDRTTWKTTYMEETLKVSNMNSK